MAVSPIITRGYGTYSTVNKVPTRGYLSASGPPPGGSGPFIYKRRGQPGKVQRGAV